MDAGTDPIMYLAHPSIALVSSPRILGSALSDEIGVIDGIGRCRTFEVK